LRRLASRQFTTRTLLSWLLKFCQARVCTQPLFDLVVRIFGQFFVSLAVLPDFERLQDNYVQIVIDNDPLADSEQLAHLNPSQRQDISGKRAPFCMYEPAQALLGFFQLRVA
jgi:hypothetical protein